MIVLNVNKFFVNSLDIFRILKTIQYGLKNLWGRRYIPGRPSCNSQKNYDPVPIVSVMAAVYALSSGLLLSAAILLAEKCIHGLINIKVE